MTTADIRPKVELPSGPLATGLRIGGRVVEGRGPRLDVVNPATGGVLAVADSADQADVEDAVDAARETFDSGVWAQMPIHDRARLMHRFADGIAARMADSTGWRPQTTAGRSPRPRRRSPGCRSGTATTPRCCSPTATRWCRCRGDYHSYTEPLPARRGRRSSRRSTTR